MLFVKNIHLVEIKKGIRKILFIIYGVWVVTRSMPFLEVGAIALFTGLISAWTLWMYNKAKSHGDEYRYAMLYNNGDSSYVLSPLRGPGVDVKVKKDDLKKETGEVTEKPTERLYWDGDKYVEKRYLKEELVS